MFKYYVGRLTYTLLEKFYSLLMILYGRILRKFLLFTNRKLEAKIRQRFLVSIYS